LTATPVVSADRRYVRLTLNPIFNALEGFDTFSIPGAVSGGPGGPGALGGLGGGGLGGVGGGARFAAGLDGVIPTGTQPGALAQGPSWPTAFPTAASPVAAAVLAGAAGTPTPPSLVAGMGEGSAPVPKAKPRSKRPPRGKPKAKAHSR